MRPKVSAGTMLAEDGIQAPESLVIATESYSTRWSVITALTSAELGRRIEKAGWTFFYMAGSIQRTAFGFSARSRTDRAVAQVIAAVERNSCNCLEITAIRERSFLGLRYASVSAYARHIQKGASFSGLSIKPATIQSQPVDWLNDRLRTIPVLPLVVGEALQTRENEGGTR